MSRYLLVFCLISFTGCTAIIDATRDEPIATNPAERSLGARIDDSRLSTIIAVNINKAHPDLDTAHVKVNIFNGVVLLSGEVPTEKLRTLAGDTARAVASVVAEAENVDAVVRRVRLDLELDRLALVDARLLRRGCFLDRGLRLAARGLPAAELHGRPAAGHHRERSRCPDVRQICGASSRRDPGMKLDAVGFKRLEEVRTRQWHALAHIEFVAIDLALDMAGRFAMEMGERFVSDFLAVAAEEHGEVQVIAAGETGVSALADLLGFLHHVSGVHADGAEMGIDGLETISVIHDDAVAVDA